MEVISEFSGMNKTLKLLLQVIGNINEEKAERIQELEGYGMLSSRHDTDIAKSQTQSSGSSWARLSIISQLWMEQGLVGPKSFS